MSKYELKLKSAQNHIEMARDDAANGDQSGSAAHTEIAQRLLREAVDIVRATESA